MALSYLSFVASQSIFAEGVQDRVICQLAAHKLPAWTVYEDESVMAFLPMEVEAYGHTIIAPKTHYVDLFSTPAEIVAVVLATVQKVGRHYQAVMGANGFNLLHASGIAAQQSVPHLHFHLIPRFDGDGLDAWPHLPGTKYGKDELLEKLRL